MTGHEYETTVEVGDVVQIDPEHDDTFGGCLLVVSNKHVWGVRGYVQVPGLQHTYHDVGFNAIERIGIAHWLHYDVDDVPAGPKPS